LKREAWSYQRFPIIKLGRRVLVERESLENFVRGNIIEARKGQGAGGVV
jgi:hypothetical protein